MPRRPSPRRKPPRRPRERGRGGAPASPDWLRLAGIQAYGHLGVTQKERELGQRVEADVELAYDTPARRRPDSLDQAFDYEEVHQLVKSQIEMSRCKLLETLAEEVAISLLAEFGAPLVRVRLRKLHLPVPDFTAIPEVVVERTRP